MQSQDNNSAKQFFLTSPGDFYEHPWCFFALVLFKNLFVFSSCLQDGEAIIYQTKHDLRNAIHRFYFFIFYRINLTEAVKLLQSFGVTNAINLDGGGSSTFVINSTVVNYPGDEKNGYGSSLSFCLFAGTNPRLSQSK